MRAGRKFGARQNSDSFVFSHESPLFGVNEQWILIKSLYQWNMLRWFRGQAHFYCDHNRWVNTSMNFWFHFELNCKLKPWKRTENHTRYELTIYHYIYFYLECRNHFNVRYLSEVGYILSLLNKWHLLERRISILLNTLVGSFKGLTGILLKKLCLTLRFMDPNPEKCRWKLTIQYGTELNIVPWLSFLINRTYGMTYLTRSQWWLGQRRMWLVKSMRPSLPMPFETSSPISASAVLNSKRHPHDPCWPATERGTGVSIALREAERGQEQRWHRGHAGWQDSGSSATRKGLCESKKFVECVFLGTCVLLRHK